MLPESRFSWKKIFIGGFSDSNGIIFLGSPCKAILQKARQVSPVIQNHLTHKTQEQKELKMSLDLYTAVDEQFVLHLEQERLRGQLPTRLRDQ